MSTINQSNTVSALSINQTLCLRYPYLHLDHQHLCLHYQSINQTSSCFAHATAARRRLPPFSSSFSHFRLWSPPMAGHGTVPGNRRDRKLAALGYCIKLNPDFALGNDLCVCKNICMHIKVHSYICTCVNTDVCTNTNTQTHNFSPPPPLSL